MQRATRTYHVVLTAILLLLISVSGVMAGAMPPGHLVARHVVLRAKKSDNQSGFIAPVDVVRGKMVRSGGDVPPLGLHNGPANSALGYGIGDVTSTFCLQSQHNAGPIELRRWKWLSGHILLGRLKAHYPTHGFW